MSCGLIDDPCDQDEYSEQNCGEEDGQRPESPRGFFLFYLLKGVVQRNCRCYGAQGSEKESGHKRIQLSRSPAPMVRETIKGGQENRNDEGDGDEIGNCQAQFAQHRLILTLEE